MLELDKKEPCSRPFNMEKGMAVAEVIEEKSGSRKLDAEDEGKLRADAFRILQQQKSDALYQGWVAGLKAKAKIEEPMD
jgi:hypothetical protein